MINGSTIYIFRLIVICFVFVSFIKNCKIIFEVSQQQMLYDIYKWQQVFDDKDVIGGTG